MAFITAGSEYNGHEAVEVILRPQVAKMKPLGIRVIDTRGAGSYKSTSLGKLSKILMPYANGWTGGSGGVLKQKKFVLAEFKAEAAYSKQDYLAVIQVEAQRLSGNEANDITGTDIANAQQEVFANGVEVDLHRVFWMGDTAKLHNSAGTYPDGTTTYVIGDVDKYYNGIDGVWKNIFTDQAGWASATTDQVRRLNINTEVLATPAVAEVETVTLTGSSGTANITVEGKTYLATFTTNLTTTTANFLTSHAATILTNHDIVVTDNVADLIFTSNTTGVPITTTTANVSGNLAGTTATTTANTLAVLAADEALEVFQKMYNNSTEELINLHDENGSVQGVSPLRIFATRTLINNYRDSLMATGTTEQAFTAVIEGVKRMMWNNIPIMPMAIDSSITNDLRGKYKHRAILTAEDNLVEVLASANGAAEAAWWFNRDENQNRSRIQLEFGANYDFPELMTVAY
jgi:hypothetical protein